MAEDSNDNNNNNNNNNNNIINKPIDLKNINVKVIQKVIKEEQKRNKEINKLIEEDKQQKRKEVVLLLLGAGESGKSTVAKQLRIINQETWNEQERLDYKSLIYSNIISSLKGVIEAVKNFGYNFSSNNEKIAQKILTFSDSKEITKDISQEIELIIKDPQFKKALGRSNEYQLIDSAPYYFESLERISQPNYIPSDQDILRSRQRTTGIIETTFNVESIHFRLVDVGGQRNERKKWIHCFESVTSVIFCAALSAYDLKLREDESVNRMHESLNLFGEICNSEWFERTDIILFLNKSDLFTEKIQRIPLTVCFPEYNESAEFKPTSEFLKKKFLSQNKNPKKIIYPHITCATDTDNITVVFKAVKGIILHDALNKSGLM